MNLDGNNQLERIYEIEFIKRAGSAQSRVIDTAKVSFPLIFLFNSAHIG